MAVNAFGRWIPTTVDEVLTLKSALVVWDMQEGIVARANEPEPAVASLVQVVAAARRARILVVYAQHTELPFEAEASSFIRSQWARSGLADPSAMTQPLLRGTPAWRILPELAPQPSDVVLEKYRISFFAGTVLAEVLAGHQIETLVVAGVATERGVLSTARDAADYFGLFPVVVEDACADFTATAHERGIDHLRTFADVCRSPDVIAAWEGKASMVDSD